MTPLGTEVDAPETQNAPWATWGLVAAVCAISLYVLFAAPETLNTFAFIPAQAARFGGLTFLTAFFLHGGIVHLLGNMYFLLVFGNNVEDRMGRGQYLLLIALATFFGNLTHLLGDPRSSMPCIGASGGIAGIMTFYAWAFPQVRLAFVFAYMLRFQWINLPAWGFILFWIGLQVIGAWQQVQGFTNVSALAHLGGAATGVVFWLLLRRQANEPQA